MGWNKQYDIRVAMREVMRSVIPPDGVNTTVADLQKMPLAQQAAKQYLTAVRAFASEIWASGKWSLILAKRNKDVISVYWNFYQNNKRASEYESKVSIYEIPLEISDDLNETLIYSGRASGQWECMDVSVDEGRSYYVEFFSVHEDSTVESLIFDVVSVVMSVPLSPESRDAMDAEKRRMAKPEIRIEETVDKFLQKQDAFDTAIQRGIEKIRAKKLNVDEEDAQIADLKDYAAALREKSGM